MASPNLQSWLHVSLSLLQRPLRLKKPRDQGRGSNAGVLRSTKGSSAAGSQSCGGVLLVMPQSERAVGSWNP